MQNKIWCKHFGTPGITIYRCFCILIFQDKTKERMVDTENQNRRRTGKSTHLKFVFYKDKVTEPQIF